MAKIKVASGSKSKMSMDVCCPPKSKMNPAKTRKRTQSAKKPNYSK